MKRFSIAVIPGDGVGQEVIPAALRVLEVIGRKFDAAFDFDEFAWGAAYYGWLRHTGHPGLTRHVLNAVTKLLPCGGARGSTVRLRRGRAATRSAA